MANLDTLIAEVWAASFLKNLDNLLVYGNTINRNYQSDLAYGNIVNVDQIGAVAIEDYVKYTDITAAEALTATQTVLTIDQQKVFNFVIDSIDEAQSRPNVMNEAMQRAAYAMASVVDAHLASFYASATTAIGGVGTEITPDASTIYGYLTQAAQILDEQNVPNDGSRYIVMNAVGVKLLRDAGEFLVATPVGDDLRVLGKLPGGQMANNFIGQAGGFAVWMSNATPDATTSTSIWQAGHPMAITMADSVNEIVGYNPELLFGDAVKGLYVYGAQIMQPDAIVPLYTDL